MKFTKLVDWLLMHRFMDAPPICFLVPSCMLQNICSFVTQIQVKVKELVSWL